MTAPVRDLQYQLNRLAGTLVADRPQLSEQGAANVWAAIPGRNLGIQGALNIKAGILNPKDYLAVRQVCNQLGGTTNQDAAFALSGLAGGGVTNLLTANQASVETGVTGFSGSGATVTRTTAHFAHGTASLQATQTSTVGYYMALVTLPAPAIAALNAAVDGSTWTMVASGKAGHASSGSARLWLMSNLTNSADSDVSTPLTLAGFTDLSYTFTIPVGTFTGADLGILVNDASTPATGITYWDKIGIWAGAGGSWVLPA